MSAIITDVKTMPQELWVPFAQLPQAVKETVVPGQLRAKSNCKRCHGTGRKGIHRLDWGKDSEDAGTIVLCRCVQVDLSAAVMLGAQELEQEQTELLEQAGKEGVTHDAN